MKELEIIHPYTAGVDVNKSLLIIEHLLSNCSSEKQLAKPAYDMFYQQK